MSVVTACCLLLVLALAGISAFLNGRELAGLELGRDEALKEAANAISLRDELTATNTVISELNKLSRQFPNPQSELLRLPSYSQTLLT